MAFVTRNILRQGKGTSAAGLVRLLSTSHAAAAAPKSYELRTYDIRRQDWDEFVRLSQAKMHLRFQVSPCSVYLCVPPGSEARLQPSNRVTHIWEYDDLVQRASVRKQLGGDESWLSEYLRPALKLMTHQSNAVMQLAPGATLRPSPASHRHFAVRKTQLHPGTSAAWLAKQTELYSSAAGGSAEPPLGTWTADIGDLDSVVDLFSYADRQSLVAHQQALDRASMPVDIELIKDRRWDAYEIAPWSPAWSAQ